MKKIVIYDSQYGNTEKVAQEVAKSISAKALKVSDAKTSDIDGIDILVIGSPTQGGRPTVALQQFLDSLPGKSLKDVKVAVFDTRLLEADVNFALKLLLKIIGYAAPKIVEIVKQKGGKLILPPEGFIVKGKEGPLSDLELGRARKWLKI